MKLVGTRILLKKPVKPDSKIVLTPEGEAQLEKDMMKQWTALEVYAVGEEVSLVKPGDKVYIPAIILQNTEIIEVEGETRLMIAERDIAIVW
jgi:hypothetical protein